MIKDKNGVPLEFGDTVLNDYQRNIRLPEHAYYRFCYEGFHNTGKTGVFIDKSGRRVEFSAERDGTIPHLGRVIAAADYKEVKQSQWISGKALDRKATVCSCCGAPIPVKSEIDTIPSDDNRYCYFCGAKMEVPQQ